MRWRQPGWRFVGGGASGKQEEGAVAVLLRGHVWWWSNRRRWGELFCDISSAHLGVCHVRGATVIGGVEFATKCDGVLAMETVKQPF